MLFIPSWAWRFFGELEFEVMGYDIKDERKRSLLAWQEMRDMDMREIVHLLGMKTGSVNI